MTLIIYFLMYKQKAPVDLLFLEFHADNDVAKITSFPPVSAKGKCVCVCVGGTTS